jgi:hypothetical protein
MDFYNYLYKLLARQNTLPTDTILKTLTDYSWREQAQTEVENNGLIESK